MKWTGACNVWTWYPRNNCHWDHNTAHLRGKAASNYWGKPWKTVKEVRKAKKEISDIKKSAVKKEVGESNESEGQSQENDIVDTVQKKMTKQVTDKILGQVPGIKQAKQLKDKVDKIKKIVS